MVSSYMPIIPFVPTALRKVTNLRKYLVRPKAPKVNLHPTPRDAAVLLFVYDNRFATTHQIMAYLRHFEGYSGSDVNIKGRLNALFQLKYLDRPPAQQIYFRSNDNIVYSLGPKGAEVLSQMYDDPSFRPSNWTNKNNRLKGRNMCHDLITAEFLLVLRIAVKMRPELKFIDKNEISINRLQPPPVSNPDPLAWKIPLTRPYDLIPDSAFALRRSGPDGSSETKYFFVETDLSTMPERRYINIAKNSSIHNKMLAYIHSRDHRLFSQNFGFKKVRILFLTPSDIRIANIIALNQRINQTAKGLFLLANMRHIDLQNPAALLGEIWQDGRGAWTGLLS